MVAFFQNYSNTSCSSREKLKAVFIFRKRVSFNVSNMCLDKARSSVFCKADKITKFEKYRKENFSRSLNQLGLFFFLLSGAMIKKSPYLVPLFYISKVCIIGTYHA